MATQMMSTLPHLKASCAIWWDMFVLLTSCLAFVNLEESSNATSVCSAMTSHKVHHTLLVMTGLNEKCCKIMGGVKEEINDNGTGDKGISEATVELPAVLENGSVVSYRI
jgi:hypothetical protein